MLAKFRVPSGTSTTPCWMCQRTSRPLALIPPISTEPALGLSNPDTARSALVLPAPFAPTMLIWSPSATKKLRRRTATAAPYQIPRSVTLISSFTGSTARPQTLLLDALRAAGRPVGPQPEIRGAELLVLPNRSHRTVGRHPAIDERHHPAGQIVDQLHVVLDDDDEGLAANGANDVL